MCGLTTEWILESAQSLACALIRRTFYALERRTTHSSEWEGTQTLRRERQAHRWPSGWGEQSWLDQQGERPITELWGAEKLGRSEGSGMLIGDPPVEGSSASSFSADARKGAVPFQHIGHIQLRTPRFHSPPCLGNGGSWIAGSRRLPLFPRKEGQARAELPHREPLTMHANRPLKDIACVLHAQTKDATVVCVIGCQITRTRIHTLPKRLASARHSRVRKLYSYQIHSARFKQTSQWRQKSWWCILPAALILWHAGSDVMGCRRPTGGVFTYVSSDRVTLRAFPVATPRGRSSSSHEGEQCDVLKKLW